MRCLLQWQKGDFIITGEHSRGEGLNKLPLPSALCVSLK